jgi:ribosomal protein L11 methylase PrmA
LRGDALDADEHATEAAEVTAAKNKINNVKLIEP